MPKLTFTADELDGYFNGRLTDDVIETAREREEALRVHADGLFPEKLIQEARPNESEDVLKYRRSIWQPKTKATFAKIVNSLSKIRRSSDWSIQYPSEPFNRIPAKESLAEYCERKFPKHTSLTNWVFTVLLRQYVIDPNAVCVVLPLEKPVDETAFVKPVPQIFNSGWVAGFEEEDFAVLEDPKGCWFAEKGEWKQGRKFYAVTTLDVLTYEQSSTSGDYTLTDQWAHNFGELPAFKLGGVMTDSSGASFLYESRIGGCLPDLDEAVREYSDLQAAVVMHLYPERWEIATVECSTCNGLGKVRTEGASPSVCPECLGSGSDHNTPFSKLMIKPAQVGEPQNPIPPAGFIQKDVEIVKLQDARFEKHIYDALAAINMEHLAQTPLAQSGIAKEVDRDETTNFVHSVAEDLVAVMDKCYYFIARARYAVQYPDPEVIATMVPSVTVPEHFDIFSTKFLEEELGMAKEKKYNPVIIGAMERAYAAKKFASDDDTVGDVQLVLELDPLASLTEDEKISRLTNKGITKEDYVLSSNISLFVRQARDADALFHTKPFKQQREVLLKMVAEIVEAEEAKMLEMQQAMMPEGTPLSPEDEEEDDKEVVEKPKPVIAA